MNQADFSSVWHTSLRDETQDKGIRSMNTIAHRVGVTELGQLTVSA